MFNDNTTIHYMFPTTVYSAIPEPSSKFVETVLNNISDYVFEPQPRKDYLAVTGEYTGKTNIHHNENLKDFFSMVSMHAKKYVEVLGLKSDIFDYYVNKSWLSIIQNKNVHIQYHDHWESDISFVYYIEVPENADCISFSNNYKSNELFPGMFDDDKPYEKTFFVERNESNFTSYFIPPLPGLLVMFPGKLNHGTIPNPSGLDQEGRRVAVAGDITLVLKKGHNDYESGRMSKDFLRKFID